MGVVYRAHDPVIDRTVAIKLVRADLLDGQDRADFLERFRREAQAAGRFSHANIVAVYDYALHEGNPFLAMEFVEGPSLAQALAQNHRFTPREAVDITRQVLGALEAAHAGGVIHRDIKPANLILPRDGRVKVTDFGISRLDSSSMTQDGSVIGTPSYMSPEQCRGEPVDLRSDLFSAAAVFYEALTGERPFPGRGITDISYRLINEPAAPVAARAPTAPAGIQPWLDRALAKSPGARFASASAMAAALRVAFEGDTDGTVLSSRPGVAGVPVPASGWQPGALDPVTLASIERKLTAHIGPIARRLLQTESARAASMEELCETLGRSIDAPAVRERFLEDVLGPTSSRGTGRRTVISAGNSAGPGTGQAATTLQNASKLTLAAAETERLQHELTRYLGPIARVLVKRALDTAPSADMLWDALARHIEKPADRQAFLRSRPS